MTTAIGIVTGCSTVPLALISTNRIPAHFGGTPVPIADEIEGKKLPEMSWPWVLRAASAQSFLGVSEAAFCFDWLQYHEFPLSALACVRLNFSSLRSLILSKQLAAAKLFSLAIASSRSTFPRSAGSGLDIATYLKQSV